MTCPVAPSYNKLSITKNRKSESNSIPNKTYRNEYIDVFSITMFFKVGVATLRRFPS